MQYRQKQKPLPPALNVFKPGKIIRLGRQLRQPPYGDCFSLRHSGHTSSLFCLFSRFHCLKYIPDNYHGKIHGDSGSFVFPGGKKTKSQKKAFEAVTELYFLILQ